MQIAQDRAKVMAANDMLSHTEPNGTKVYDRLSADAIQWYAAGEIISYRFEPAMYDAVKGTIAAWMASSGHRAIMLSTNYNYVGYGVAVSASGKRYFAGVFVKQRDETGAWSKFGSVTKRSVDARHVRVTIHWSGADTRLQVLTAGLRYFEVQARRSGDWLGSRGARRPRPVTARPGVRGTSYYVRVRARDKAGNWGAWHTDAHHPLIRPPPPESGADGRDERPMAEPPGAGRSAPTLAEPRMRIERLGQRLDEAGLRPADRSRSPTTGRGRAASRLADRTAARSGRRADRRTGPAARSSPSAAWPPGRRPPRRSRSRTARAGSRGPRRTDRAAPGTPRRAGPDAVSRRRRAGRSPRGSMKRSPRTPSTLTGTRAPSSTSSARSSPDRRSGDRPRLGPARCRTTARHSPSARGGRGRDSATAACAGAGRARPAGSASSAAGNRRSTRS